MAHIHAVKDTDVHYKIDGITRTIVNVDETKRMLVQNDHNSERLTFEVPRYVDGHDLSECNVVQVHYVNSDIYEKNHSSDIYEVDDLGIKGNSDEDKNVVVLSWLVHGNATKYVGTLNFVIRFSCVMDGYVDYAWNTTIYKGITILPGIYNSEQIAERYSDILSYHSGRLNTLENSSGVNAVKTVNGVAPDENGNVNVEGGSGGSGEPGADGFSPVATVTQTGSGAVISITDKSGTTAATVFNGKDGKDGYTPVKGVDYFDGAPGKDGVDGKDGAKGDKGDPGEKGDTGAPGADGAKGDKGDKGDTGAQGNPGKDGADGKDGSNGKDGVSATHSWNGTTLTITSASGTSSANLKGEKGDKGDKGDQGIQGIQGIQGEKGDTGAAGSNGTNGKDGANGTSVTVKSVSESTVDGGSNVVTFSDGKTVTIKNGSKGSKGDKGDKGDTGATGATGAAGKNGADGYTPVRGTDYWTEADKVEIVQRVIESLGGNPIFGIVDESNNIVVSGDLPDGTYSVKYEMENGTKLNIGNLVIDTNVYYTVTNTLTQCTTNNSATKAVQGGSYSATITAKSGYELKSIVVKMGGTNISSTAVSGGKITISNVTGNIEITATATEIKAKYTNLADPTSADWANGKRFDGSGNLKDVDAGVNGATTNYIGGGFAVGDTIRIKGMDLSGSAYRTAVYNKNKAQQSLATLSGQGSYFSDISVNSTGASFKIKSNVPSDGYLRFSGILNGTSADVIITKNEEIA